MCHLVPDVISGHKRGLDGKVAKDWCKAGSLQQPPKCHSNGRKASEHKGTPARLSKPLYTSAPLQNSSTPQELKGTYSPTDHPAPHQTGSIPHLTKHSKRLRDNPVPITTADVRTSCQIEGAANRSLCDMLRGLASMGSHRVRAGRTDGFGKGSTWN